VYRVKEVFHRKRFFEAVGKWEGPFIKLCSAKAARCELYRCMLQLPVQHITTQRPSQGLVQTCIPMRCLVRRSSLFAPTKLLYPFLLGMGKGMGVGVGVGKGMGMGVASCR
jgi:hypothetical protein